MNETILTIIFVLIVTIVVSFFSYKQKQSAWKGELVKKKENYDDESGVTSYRLIFKTNEGKKKTIQVTGRQAFEAYTIGDKVEKKKGEYIPVKI